MLSYNFKLYKHEQIKRMGTFSARGEAIFVNGYYFIYSIEVNTLVSFLT